MGLKTNTIITLENNEKYVVLNETMYGGSKYFLVMGIDDKLEVVPNKVKIIEEILDGSDVYIDTVTDSNLIVILTRLLKAQMQSSFFEYKKIVLRLLNFINGGAEEN